MRIERRRSRGRTYLVAIEERHEDGRLRRVAIATFGREGEPRTKRRLQGFLDALEGSDQYPKQNRRNQP